MQIRLASRSVALAAAVLLAALGAPRAHAEPFDVRASQADRQMDGAQFPEFFTNRDLSAGDIDGDGREEFVRGRPTPQAPHTDRGSVGVWKVIFHPGPPASATNELIQVYWGEWPGDEFGAAVDATADFDGDGRSDLIIGAPGANAARGKVFVFSSATFQQLLALEGEAPGDRFGAAVAAGPDIDGDGAPEVLVGAPGSDALAHDAGRAYVYSSGAGALLGTYTGETPGGRLGVYITGGVRPRPAFLRPEMSWARWDIKVGARRADGGAAVVFVFREPTQTAAAPRALPHLNTDLATAITEFPSVLSRTDVFAALLQYDQTHSGGLNCAECDQLPTCFKTYCIRVCDAALAHQLAYEQATQQLRRIDKDYRVERGRALQDYNIAVILAGDDLALCAAQTSSAALVAMTIGAFTPLAPVGMAVGVAVTVPVGSVICGLWHADALREAEEDRALRLQRAYEDYRRDSEYEEQEIERADAEFARVQQAAQRDLFCCLLRGFNGFGAEPNPCEPQLQP